MSIAVFKIDDVYYAGCDFHLTNEAPSTGIPFAKWNCYVSNHCRIESSKNVLGCKEELLKLSQKLQDKSIGKLIFHQENLICVM